MTYELVRFETENVESEEQFVRDYVLDAVARLPEQPFCETIGFVRESTSPTSSGGGVQLMFVGDREQLVEHERETWEQFSEQGVISNWETDDHPWNQAPPGMETPELSMRLTALASRLSIEVFDELDHQLAAVDEYPDENTPSPTGWWVLLHQLTNQQGYTPEEEIAASMQNIRNHLHYVAQQQSIEHANKEIDELIETLEEIREDVKTPQSDRE